MPSPTTALAEFADPRTRLRVDPLPSVTPLDADCQALMMRRLEAAGFALEPMRIEGGGTTSGARRGGDGPVLCFAGHTDVVPTGPLQAWQHQPSTP